MYTHFTTKTFATVLMVAILMLAIPSPGEAYTATIPEGIKDFSIRDKQSTQGTLNYLYRSGIWDHMSVYYSLSTPSSLTGDNIPTGYVLRYKVVEREIYCIDKTGVVVDEKPNLSDGETYTTITIKDIVPEIYEFHLRNYTYGEADHNTGTHGIDVDYIVNKESFYHYLPETVMPRMDTLTDSIDGGVFMELANNSREGYYYTVKSDIDDFFQNGGGAIYNYQNAQKIDHIIADFYDNQAMKGGAILNGTKWGGEPISSIGTIRGVFMNNHADYEGGAIWNFHSSIDLIDGDFIANNAGRENDIDIPEESLHPSADKVANNWNRHPREGTRGGAIYNYGDDSLISYIGTITGSFIGNYVSGTRALTSENSTAGGAIFNANGGVIDMIIADFLGNVVKIVPVDGVVYGEGHGGAIFNGGGGTNSSWNLKGSLIKYVIGDFIGNHVEVVTDADKNRVNEEDEDAYAQLNRNHGNGGAGTVWGGAITSIALEKGGWSKADAVIEHIVGDFIRNYVRGLGTAGGGAIYNNRGSLIKTLEGNFIRNYARSDYKWGAAGYIASGGAILNYHSSNGSNTAAHATIEYLKSNFYNNYALATGTATAQGGAISNHTNYSTIGTIEGDFIGNFAQANKSLARGGAIYAEIHSAIDKIIGNFYDNYAYSEENEARGGAIANGGDLNAIINSVFEGNYANGFNLARGGAIYNQKDATLDIIADDGVCFFRDNYTITRTKDNPNGVKLSEALFCDAGSVTNLIARNNGAIIFSDMINGDRASSGFEIHLMGDRSGSVTFKNYVKYGDVILDDVTLVVQVPEDQDDALDKELGASYLSDEWREKAAQEIDGEAGSSARSAVLRQAPLFANSGRVQLADGQITDYLFSIIYATGIEEAKANAAECAKNNGTAEEIEKAANAYTLFNIDVDLSRGVSDVLTVFGITSDGGETWMATPNKDNRLSVSNGHITLNPTFYFENNSYELERSKAFQEQLVTVQVINFVMMHQEQGGIYSNEADYEKFKTQNQYSDQIIQLSDISFSNHEKSHMKSRDILAADLHLTTTKTLNDSLAIRGWRDHLAAWAELYEDDLFDDGAFDPWQESDKALMDKVFEVDGYIALTRDLVDTKNPENTITRIQGDNVTIFGHGTAENSNILHASGHNFLQEVAEGQSVTLQNFILAGIEGIRNKDTLVLDTVRLVGWAGKKDAPREARVTIQNEADLTVKGHMTIDNMLTITTKADKMTDSQKMVITDQSAVGDKSTIVTISGTVENQNVYHEGSGLLEQTNNDALGKPELTQESLESFTTVTRLQTDAITAFRNNALTMNGGLFRMDDMGLNRLKLRELHLNGGAIYVGTSTVNLNRRIMGGIDAGIADYGQAAAALDLEDDTLTDIPATSSGDGIIWLNNVMLKGDTNEVVSIKFVDAAVADTVQADRVHKHTFMGDVFEYELFYNKNADQQYNGQTLGTITIIPTRNVNPVVQAGAVTQLAGSYVSMMQVYDYAFMHADLYSPSLYAARQQRLYSGLYTVVNAKEKGGASEQNTCPATAAGLNRGLWLRTYSSHEDMPLRHGPKVSSNMYGGIVGGDTTLREHRGGWASVYSLYGGYLGSTQKYDGVRTKQNGGVIGITGTFYKQNFYTALTASLGTAGGDTTSRYGSEDFHLFMGGIASRTGYSFGLGNGRYVVQPTLLMSYTCFDVRDYTNAAGVEMKAKPTHVLQVHPYIKLVQNTDCTWKPYATLGYVYDVMGKTRFKANEYQLPSLSVKPYVEYSLGAQRSWRDRYTLYLQATGRNGGRRGTEGSMGLRTTF